MAVFEVETGGKVFEIEAPDQQSAIAALDSFARRNGANNGIGVSGDEIRAANAGDGMIRMDVADSGPGVAADRAATLFEPLTSGKVHGLGLGLAISAGFAGELGGRLVARNAPDGGAVFELLLPRDRSQAQAAE